MMREAAGRPPANFTLTNVAPIQNSLDTPALALRSGAALQILNCPGEDIPLYGINVSYSKMHQLLLTVMIVK